MARGRRRSALLGLAVVVVAAAGCSGSDDEAPKPPEFANPTLECTDSMDPDVDGNIVSAVSIEVTDPDRDLKVGEQGLEGTFDSLPIALKDDDADRRFTWRPSEDENRIRCPGEHHLVVHAEDAEGNEATFDERITKNGSS